MMPERKVLMDLKIKYENGSMVIHLENFLNCHSISKVRKLVKIIRSSFTPECEGIIREYVEQEIEQFEPRQQEISKYIIGYQQKIDYSDRGIYTASTYRSRYKKGSEPWKYHNEKLKQFREENKELKAALRSRQSEYDKNIKNKDFYKKVLEIIT